MLFQRVAAGENQGVEFAKTAVDRPGVSPGLRRTAPGDCATRASRSIAALLAVLPEQVHRTDQPVLVRRHDPGGTAAKVEDARSPDQRNIVEMDDVGLDRVELLLRASALK